MSRVTCWDNEVRERLIIREERDSLCTKFPKDEKGICSGTQVEIILDRDLRPLL